MSYATFKAAVLKAAGYVCENPACDAEADTVHHFLKASVWPAFSEDAANGMAACGRCHSEIERRQREGEDFLELYPIGRYRVMLARAGIEVPEGMEPGERSRKAEALERRAAELRAGQRFIEGT